MSSSPAAEHREVCKRKRRDEDNIKSGDERASKKSKFDEVSVKDFHEAAARGDKPLCKAYVLGGGEVDAVLDKRLTETALWQAARAGELGVCLYLLKHGASVHSEDGVGRTVMHAAALSGCKDTMEMICEQDPRILEMSNDDYLTPLYYIYDAYAGAKETRDKAVDIAAFLIELGADTSSQEEEITDDWLAFIKDAKAMCAARTRTEAETI